MRRLVYPGLVCHEPERSTREQKAFYVFICFLSHGLVYTGKEEIKLVPFNLYVHSFMFIHSCSFIIPPVHLTNDKGSSIPYGLKEAYIHTGKSV